MEGETSGCLCRSNWLRPRQTAGEVGSLRKISLKAKINDAITNMLEFKRVEWLQSRKCDKNSM